MSQVNINYSDVDFWLSGFASNVPVGPLLKIKVEKFLRKKWYNRFDRKNGFRITSIISMLRTYAKQPVFSDKSLFLRIDIYKQTGFIGSSA